MGSEGAEIIKGGSSLVRLENETQITMAIQHPREEAAILKACLNELDIYPSAAEEAIYVKPVGKDDSGAMKYAEGLSIRAAESIACRWSNSAFGVQLESDDGTVVRGTAIFLDYERNTRRAMAFSVSRKYKSKGGATYSYSEDRFHNTVVPAAASKKLREVILRSLPAGLKIEYENKARLIMEKSSKGDPDKINLAVASFARIGVGVPQLEKYLGMNLEAARKNDKALVSLRGAFQSIQDGEATIEELFPKETPAPVVPNGNKAANLADKLKASAPPPPSDAASSSDALPGMGEQPSIDDLTSMVTDRLVLCNDGSGATYTLDIAQERLDALLKDCRKGKLKLENIKGAIEKNPGLASALLDAAAARGW
jgi:hypothetical protein